MKRLIISSLIIWSTIVVLGSGIFSVFQNEFPIGFIFFDVLGYSVLLSLPWLALFIAFKFLIHKYFSNIFYRRFFIVVIAGVLCYLTFILFLFFIENELRFTLWDRELTFLPFLIYFAVTCSSAFLWEKMLVKIIR